MFHRFLVSVAAGAAVLVFCSDTEACRLFGRFRGSCPQVCPPSCITDGANPQPNPNPNPNPPPWKPTDPTEAMLGQPPQAPSPPPQIPPSLVEDRP